MLPLICNGVSVNNCEGTSRHNDILGVVKHAVTALALDNPGLDSLMSCHLEQQCIIIIQIRKTKDNRLAVA